MLRLNVPYALVVTRADSTQTGAFYVRTGALIHMLCALAAAAAVIYEAVRQIGPAID